MPLTILQYKADQDLDHVAHMLAVELPDIVAPALTLPQRAQLDGLVNPDDIIVWTLEGTPYDVNTNDFEIIIWAHDFPERRANLDERTEMILKGVRDFLSDYDRNVTGFVWILLQPTAFGRI